ncbi:carbohydrate ABC transporter permease [Lachnoclostridium phytofermentans]|uniref:Maltose/maltodextrin transport system permease protein n=1 Tax=Lachnoclostridium phytofermentans (strain ATCC 700394 / DSM 18823 / ISDg) TaxID=357809 RepID=A9KKT6_LACP7|nr:sugar ABC transporter permease [Lachnoclostridium phytofermentans]ABX42668.1 binding-protein-dependent transport systems inner membrane component [Lachnoclostridium phytofermentans ISDg]
MKFLTAACSAVVWGSGQVINKQRLKGLMFFIVQAILVWVEMFTGTFAVITGRTEATFRNCGFFIKGIWGLITLGEIPRENSNVIVYDHSIMLLISGIIAATILLVFLFVYIWNIKDAYSTRKKMESDEVDSSIGYFKKLWNNSFEYIVIAPGLLMVAFIVVIPILFSLLVVFTNYNANFIPPKKIIEWTGFQTFRDIVTIKIWGTTFIKILIWTIVWAFLATFSSYTFGLLQAVLVNSKSTKFKKIWRGIFILPWAVPGLVSMLIFRAMLNHNGAVNAILLDLGLISEKIPFLSNTNWARFCLIMVNLWLGFPYFMMLISGVLTTIPEELYEAAQMDGANGFQLFRKISFPYIISATAPQIVMSVTHNFNNFGLIYFLTGGEPANPTYQMAGSTDILISWIFKLTLNQRMYNYAAAMSIFIFIVVASVSGFNLLRTRAFKED